MMSSDFAALLQMVLPLFIAAVIPGILCSKLAKKKGYSGKYFWMGFFLSIFGLVYVAGLPVNQDS